MTRPLTTGAALLLLSACAASPDTGRYVGTVTPTQISPLCQPSRAVLQIRDGNVIFAPDEGTWVLDGTTTPDGAITATRSRPITNNQTYQTTLEAHRTGAAITGTYRTPRCTGTVSLTKT